MPPRANKILLLIGVLSLIVLLFLEIFLDYDTATRQLALALTNVAVLLIITGVYWFFKSKHGFTLPFYVVWLAALGVWFDAAGNFAHLYHNIIWWDNLAHAVGSAALALALFIILYELNKRGKIKLGLFGLSLFTLSLTVFFSVLYEISEYFGDLLTESNRITDKFDTVSDLMWNTIATLGVVIIASLVVRRRPGQKSKSSDQELEI